MMQTDIYAVIVGNYDSRAGKNLPFHLSFHTFVILPHYIIRLFDHVVFGNRSECSLTYMLVAYISVLNIKLWLDGVWMIFFCLKFR